jgi:hypothetical protein
MENTPHKQHSPDDLEYLARLGFEQVPVDEEEVQDLVKKVRARSFSYNSGAYFAGLCLLVGVFLGASAFFAVYEPAPDRLVVTSSFVEVPAQVIQEPLVQQLDTVTVDKENFERPGALPAKAAEKKKDVLLSPAETEQEESASVLSGKMDVSALLKESFNEEKLRYIANAPVFYIHDLKITDYRLLYFKHNHFVALGGTSATYAGKENPEQNYSRLKQSADYYLHEELALALLQFKKGKYDACIGSLNLVATYNKEDINCSFYLGLCYYYKKNYGKAIQLLDQCIGSMNNTFLQEAMFYKALCLFEAGNKAEAAALFKQISEEGEFYAGKAEAYLKTMD